MCTDATTKTALVCVKPELTFDVRYIRAVVDPSKSSFTDPNLQIWMLNQNQQGVLKQNYQFEVFIFISLDITHFAASYFKGNYIFFVLSGFHCTSVMHVSFEGYLYLKTRIFFYMFLKKGYCN